MATFRNLAIGIHRMTGAINIAQATRHAAWNPPGRVIWSSHLDHSWITGQRNDFARTLQEGQL